MRAAAKGEEPAKALERVGEFRRLERGAQSSGGEARALGPTACLPSGRGGDFSGQCQLGADITDRLVIDLDLSRDGPV